MAARRCPAARLKLPRVAAIASPDIRAPTIPFRSTRDRELNIREQLERRRLERSLRDGGPESSDELFQRLASNSGPSKIVGTD